MEPYDAALDTLNTAGLLFTGPRKEKYGDPLKEFTRIGRMVGAVLNREDLPPEVVASVLICMKLIRAQESPDHQDNWIDLAAYAALAYDTYRRTHEKASNTRRKVRRPGLGNRRTARD